VELKKSWVIGNYGVVRKMHWFNAALIRRDVLSPTACRGGRSVASDKLRPPNIEMSGATPRTSVRSVPNGLNQVQPRLQTSRSSLLLWSGASFLVRSAQSTWAKFEHRTAVLILL
jgi:hypothetical protein